MKTRKFLECKKVASFLFPLHTQEIYRKRKSKVYEKK